MAIRPGLCSVTFRALPPARIAGLAADAGLEAIEWAGDVHVRPGDARGAAEVARITADAGLAVASYGSYFRATPGEEIGPVLDCAEALGADRIRVWAGTSGSSDIADDGRADVTRSLASAADEAHDRGMRLALEYHGGTLADGPDAVLRLLADVDHPALRSYWQPTVAAPDDVAVAEYAQISAYVEALHVFSWWPAIERLPLRERAGMWEAVFAEASAQSSPPRDALLEFVPDDDPALLPAEAAELRRLLDAKPWESAGGAGQPSASVTTARASSCTSARCSGPRRLSAYSL